MRPQSPKRGFERRELRTVLCAALALCFIFSHATAHAASAKKLNKEVDAALKLFHKKFPEARETASKAHGILVFPSVIKAGFGIGGEFGEGALRVNGKTAGYYSTAGASVGLQFGAQKKTVVFLFMTRKALRKFLDGDGWSAGVDASVALAKAGAGGKLDSETLQKPVIAFIFGNEGLMYNLTIEGTKVTKIKK